MAITLSGTVIRASVATRATNIETTEPSPAVLNLMKAVELTLADGGAAGQADHVWARWDTALAAGANWDIDFDGGEVNVFGDAISFTEIKVILIVNNDATGDPEIEIGGAPANEFVSWVGAALDTVVLPAGGLFLLACPGNATTNGYVTAAGTDTLRIHNNDGADAANVDVVILGCIA